MGFFDKIKEGLAKTKKAMAQTLDAIFIGGEIDDDFYEELTDWVTVYFFCGTVIFEIVVVRAVLEYKDVAPYFAYKIKVPVVVAPVWSRVTYVKIGEHADVTPVVAPPTVPPTL